MKITQLARGNAQFPTEKDIGDVVILHSGDMFCWDGSIWQLLGGRFLPKKFREAFLDYIRDGFPDPLSAIFDLSLLFDLKDMFKSVEEIESAEEREMMEKLATFNFIDKFKNRIVEVAEKCEEAKNKIEAD